MKLLKFATAMVLLAGWALAALSLHVVRTASSVHLIPKNELSVADTYVDVSQWTRDDEEKHVVLFARLKQLDQISLLEAAAPTESLDAAPAAPAVATADVSGMKKAWDRANRVRR